MAEPETEGRGFTPRPGVDDWRALLDVPIEKLVVDGVQPLYVEGPAPAVRPGTGRFGVCMRSDAAHVAEDIDGGADAVWLRADDREAMRDAAERGARIILDSATDPGSLRPDAHDREAFRARFNDLQSRVSGLWAGFDAVDASVRGWISDDVLTRDVVFEQVLRLQRDHVHDPRLKTVCVSGIGFHHAGADAADEIALMTASLVAKLRIAESSGVDGARIGAELWLQIAVGRDTFGELCKLRALRIVMGKLLVAAGSDARPPIHAVCSSRTQSQRDPWVNMLRVSTEVFAAALGGADLITPLPFDAALGESSTHSRRVARNTALVLREESHLGRVIDAAGGSYYIESRTDALAREAWSRFQAIERDGGIVTLISSGKLRERLAASWATRTAAIAKRKEPVLGVSEFANLDETLPVAATVSATEQVAHRDGEGFEALRARIEREPARLVALVTLGAASEHRARVGFAQALFATAGLRAREMTLAEAIAATPSIACICGSDERYATEAVSSATQLQAIGALKIVLAGRPGALEADLRAAGVANFVYIGADVLAALMELTS